MSIFSAIGNSLSKAFKFLEEKKVIAVLTQGTNLLPFALPIAHLIATLTPTNLDDQALAVIEKYGIPQATLFLKGATGIDKIIKDGGKQKIAIELLRNKLIEIVKSGGTINLGDAVISTVEQVLGLGDNNLAVAVESAVALIKGKPVVAVPVVEPVTITEPPRTVAQIEERLTRLRGELTSEKDPVAIDKLNKKISRQLGYLDESKKREGKF